MRIDRVLFERGLVPSRTQAQELIAAGRVILIDANGARLTVKKPSHDIADPIHANIEILASLAPDYVSRGGNKMHGALERIGLRPEGFTVLDVGISTGGFADCLLQAGATCIVGVDVGHGQLAAKLRTDPRVHLLEGVNARDLSKAPVFQFTAGRKFDLIVIDVSFISLQLVVPEVISYLKDGHRILALVKPQFEVGRDGLGKNGIVRDPARFDEVREKIERLCADQGLTLEDYFASSIDGSDGNKEFFVYARKS